MSPPTGTRIQIFGPGPNSFLPQRGTNVYYFIDERYMYVTPGQTGQEARPTKKRNIKCQWV